MQVSSQFFPFAPDTRGSLALKSFYEQISKSKVCLQLESLCNVMYLSYATPPATKSTFPPQAA